MHERTLWYLLTEHAWVTLLPRLLISGHPLSSLADPRRFPSPLPRPIWPLPTVPSLLIAYCPLLDSLLLLLLSFIVIFQFGRLWLLYLTLLSPFLAQAMFLWVSPKRSPFPLQTSLFLIFLSSLFLASFSLCMFSVCSHKLFFMNPKTYLSCWNSWSVESNICVMSELASSKFSVGFSAMLWNLLWTQVLLYWAIGMEEEWFYVKS